MDRKEFCEFYEQLLKAQLAVVRQFPGDTGRRRDTAQKGRSQVSIAKDILEAAGEPLHVTEIIKRAKEQFDTTIDRESLVSALTKKVKKGGRLVRTAPNTFALAPEPTK
jgi:predicted transcriptional regulator